MFKGEKRIIGKRHMMKSELAYQILQKMLIMNN